MAKAKRIPTQFRCPACGENVEARLIGSDAESRRPRIMFRSLPAMICPHCDSTPDPQSRAVWATIELPPPDAPTAG